MARIFLDSAPPPTEDPITGAGGMLTAAWREYFLRLPDTLSAIPSRLNVVERDGLSSSVSATDFSGGRLSAGLYRATFYAFPSSGTLTVTVSWTDGTARSWSSTATSDSVMFRSDADAAVNYSTTYSGGGTYGLDIVLERVKA